MMQAANDATNYNPILISDEDLVGIRDSTLDMCRLQQQRYATTGGNMAITDDLRDFSRQQFFKHYAIAVSKTYDEVKDLKEVDGFVGMGCLIQVLEASKFGGK